ncbi:hypothetical protein DESC_40133 [Desulfosarcina cetonica]|uniref:Cthe_2314 family HEPN domain-containing protein n=1 Tax=Desulfosarcina cetonica TaxID=90730 RepID=UPI0006CF62AC|nr:Cthe_2314 family HEPN domain-containing protein [Desulfosarcina cetonica]VTR66102.1 hypothetical protein DESC_40133 [Desulfosarcina cetonica]
MLHIENENIKPLLPFFTSYLKKGLRTVIEGKTKFDGTVKEKYAHDICARINQIDNSLQSLALCLEYLKKSKFDESDYNFSIHHTFHIENYLLRLTSVVDRCYLVAGTSILLKEKSIEKIGGNKKITNKLKLYSIESVKILKNISGVVKPLRKMRNEVAHKAGYSNKNLDMLGFIIDLDNRELENKFESIMSIDDLKFVIIKDTIDLFQPPLRELHILVDELILSLSFIYQSII